MILLDTHAYYWFIMDDPHLPAHIKNLISDSEKIYISCASFWEMTIKSSLGKMELPADIDEMMAACEVMGMDILPIQAHHLKQLQSLPWIHRDPFDRLIISQAQAENLVIVTVDENIARYNVKTLW